MLQHTSSEVTVECLRNRPQVSKVYRLINHAGCWKNSRRIRKPMNSSSVLPKWLISPQAAQALVVRSYHFFKKKSLCERSARETSYRDIVTAVIHCYITTLCETWLWSFSMWRCYVTTVWIYKVCMGENIKRYFSRNFDIFSIKMTYLNALLSFLLSSCFSECDNSLKRLRITLKSERTIKIKDNKALRYVIFIEKISKFRLKCLLAFSPYKPL